MWRDDVSHRQSASKDDECCGWALNTDFGKHHKHSNIQCLVNWGLAFISKKRKERARAIAQYLASQQYDIVCLQECWVYKDFEYIRDQISHNLPNSRFFNSGALGSGLAIFTRYPIIEARVMPYDLSGTPQQAVAGDFFVNKGAGYVVIDHPMLGEVEIWTNHMHAGGESAPDTRQAHRMGEAWQLANAIKAGAMKGRYVIVTGDFNSQPFSVPIALLRTQAEVFDAFLVTHPNADISKSQPRSPEEGIHEFGMSCDSPLNSWSADKNIPDHIKAQGGKRLDYIFYRNPHPKRRRKGQLDQTIDDDETTALLKCVDCKMVLTENVPGTDYSYSDHAGMVATFSIESSISNQQPSLASATNGELNSRNTSSATESTFTPANQNSLHSSSLTTSKFPSEETPFHPQKPNSISWPNSFATSSKAEVLRQTHSTLSSYAFISAKAASRHLMFSVASLVVLLGLTTGSAWQPKSYFQPIFSVICGLAGASCVTFFYLGFVWGRWEKGILDEVKQEIELELQVAKRNKSVEYP